MGAQKNRLIETVLLSSQNICLDYGNVLKNMYNFTIDFFGLSRQIRIPTIHVFDLRSAYAFICAHGVLFEYCECNINF